MEDDWIFRKKIGWRVWEEWSEEKWHHDVMNERHIIRKEKKREVKHTKEGRQEN